MNDTNLTIQSSQIPNTFRGGPTQFQTELLRRMKIVSPSGSISIFIGDTEPTSNVGPWLKGGTKWYIFSEGLKRYVPLDITDSEKKWFQTGTNPPSSAAPPVWLKTTKDASEADPSIGDPISWYVHNGTGWVPFVGIVLSGTTASRPSAPVEFQQFYDTTITCLIWWERNSWRTVSGVPGDVKFVTGTVLTDVLTHNPGWVLFGEGNQILRGRGITMATKDGGSSPETVLTVAAGVPQRAAFETSGESTILDLGPDGVEPTTVYPATVALWCLTKE